MLSILEILFVISTFFSVKVPATKGPSHPGIAPTALVIPRILKMERLNLILCRRITLLDFYKNNLRSRKIRSNV